MVGIITSLNRLLFFLFWTISLLVPYTKKTVLFLLSLTLLMAGAYPACTPNGGISGDGQRRSLCQKEGCAAPYRRCHLNSCLCLHTSGAQNSSRIFLCPFEVVPEKAVLRCREGDVRNQYVSFLPAMPPVSYFHIPG